ncbi:hypothetical protein KSS87_012084 [Heliosperma pusillum]|nr:hypothetical protein KSS87_012084 [Heliosperma pusillum]
MNPPPTPPKPPPPSPKISDLVFLRMGVEVSEVLGGGLNLGFVTLGCSKVVATGKGRGSVERGCVWSAMPTTTMVVPKIFLMIVFRPLIPVIGYRAVLALSGYVINNVAFVLAALYFYRYTESLYALFSIGGVYYLMSGANNTSVLLLSLSSSARSNGVINAGYCGFKMLHQAYHAVYVKKRSLLAVKVLLAGVFRCICIFIPFLAFQAYGYYNLCHGRNPDEMRPWCRTKVPLLYSFIQSQYWGVGFLRYFQLKQSPNFLLASPVLSLAFCSIFSYLKFEPEKFFSLGFGIASKENNSANEPFSKGEEQRFDDHRPTKQDLRRRQQNAKPRVKPRSAAEREVSVKGGYNTVEMLPFIYHLSFMAATALFVMHVQVSTRFLSASPPLYWYASYLMGCIERRRWAYLVWAYAASYILLGSLLFSNFYPFT